MPPKVPFRSTKRVFAPTLAAVTAAKVPAAPPPITTTSHSCSSGETEDKETIMRHLSFFSTCLAFVIKIVVIIAWERKKAKEKTHKTGEKDIFIH